MHHRDMDGLQDLALLNIHVQNIIQGSQAFFNSGPAVFGPEKDKISKDYLLESFERAEKFIKAAKEKIFAPEASQEIL